MLMIKLFSLYTDILAELPEDLILEEKKMRNQKRKDL